MAVNRYDQRKGYEQQEANAIAKLATAKRQAGSRCSRPYGSIHVCILLVVALL